MSIRMLLAIAAAASLVGCAAPILDAQVKRSIPVVSIEPVQVSDLPAMAAPGAAAIAVLPGSGGLAGMEQAAPDIKAAYRSIVARTVDIGPALAEQLKLQLQRKGFIVVPAGGRADAKLTTRATYGLATAQLASETRLVSLVMFLELTATDGRVLYRHQYIAGADRPFFTQGKIEPLSRWLTDEALVEEQNKRMVERAAAQITQGL